MTVDTLAYFTQKYTQRGVSIICVYVHVKLLASSGAGDSDNEH